MTSNDDEAWRAIVDNYGERARLDPDDEVHRRPVAGDRRPDEPDRPGDDSSTYDDQAAAAPQGDESWRHEPDVDPFASLHAAQDADAQDDEAFVPPEPPPVPETTWDRRAAWFGVIGGPALLLLALVTGIDLPQWFAVLLVLGFVGGFVYLVARMPREPRDPFDDGARI
ncbi:MAG: hypothetical protein CMH83_08585 [Nocardioides sp.]|nr:hypothetical protein [Nocardioides sp.]